METLLGKTIQVAVAAYQPEVQQDRYLLSNLQQTATQTGRIKVQPQQHKLNSAQAIHLYMSQILFLELMDWMLAVFLDKVVD